MIKISPSRKRKVKTYKKYAEKLVNSTDPKKIDKISFVLYGIMIFLGTLLLVNYTSILYRDTTFVKIPVFIYFILIMVPLLLFYITMISDQLKLQSKRIPQFILIVSFIAVVILNYIGQTLGIVFTNIVKTVDAGSIIPFEYIKSNIVIFSFFVPAIVLSPAYIILMKSILKREVKNVISTYEEDVLTRIVYPSNDTSIDLQIGQDIETGEDCVVPEKKLYEHKLILGGTGSGKTATALLPDIDQLLYKKGHLIEYQKELALKALSEGVAYLKFPVSNHWLNNNFSMNYIGVNETPKAKNRFKEIMKPVIIGERKYEARIFSEDVTQDIEFYVNKPRSGQTYEFIVIEYKNRIETASKTFKLQKDEDIFSLNGVKIEVKKEYIGENNIFKPNLIINNSEVNPRVNEDGEELKVEALKIRVTGVPRQDPENISDYINMSIVQKDVNGIIYKNLGLTVVSPDGELSKNVIKLASTYGVKVHKIDPDMSEINTGGIARNNPLAGGASPEKIADNISSVLMALEASDGGESKAYFANASVRAVRNIVILLKIAYPLVHNGEQPILTDVLDVLNSPDKVIVYTEKIAAIPELAKSWSSVIDYMRTSFYPTPTGDNGRPLPNVTIGMYRQKTIEAIGGVINQLDNFLGRKEIRYILCNRDESTNINLGELLANGECLAISTRQNDLGQKLGKAFALFFILSLQTEVLSRYAESENPEIPHFLYIDEFPFYINAQTKNYFTFARKYKCSTTVVIQNLAQLKEEMKAFQEIIVANTDTKIVLSKNNAEDRKYISELFGYEEREINKVSTKETSILATDKPKLEESYSVDIKEVKRVTEADIQSLSLKQGYVQYTNNKNKQILKKVITDFVKQDYSFKVANYDFEKYNPSGSDYSEIAKQPTVMSNSNIKIVSDIDPKEVSSNSENVVSDNSHRQLELTDDNESSNNSNVQASQDIDDDLPSSTENNTTSNVKAAENTVKENEVKNTTDNKIEERQPLDEDVSPENISDKERFLVVETDEEI